MNNFENWALWVGQDPRDLLIWSDIKVEQLPKLKQKDTKRWLVDQSYWIYTMACTFMSSYTAILSIWNMDSKESEKKRIVYDAVKFDNYTIWRWRWTQPWVRRSCKSWNEIHPDKMVGFAQIVIGSDDWYKVIALWYLVVTTYKTSGQYYNDIIDDWIVVKKSTSWFTGGHALCSAKSNKAGFDWMHRNTYPKGKYNDYYVKYGYDLVKSGTYYATWYVIFEDIDWIVENVLKLKLQSEELQEENIKRQLINDQMAINSKLWKMAKSQGTKDRLHEMNEYRRSVWF